MPTTIRGKAISIAVLINGSRIKDKLISTPFVKQHDDNGARTVKSKLLSTSIDLSTLVVVGLLQ